MRADRLTRKTYLKKHHVRPDGEITIYDLTGAPTGAQTTRLDAIAAPQEMSCEKIAALPDTFETAGDILAWCAAVMAESPVASRLWAEARKAGWSVGIAELHSAGFHLDIPGRQILLDHFSMSPASLGRSPYFRNTLLITFIRALRDIWHEQRVAVPFENEYAPEDVLMLERVRAADCDAVTVLAVWELRGAGYAEIWRHLIGSAEGDMALIFTRFLERDPTALFDGSALTHAFRQWYADEIRVDGCDHETLETLDDVLLGSGESKPFGEKHLDASALESLAMLPDGTCYLAGLGDTILHDPFFAGLRDEINQTHLFQLMYDMEVTMVNNVPFRDRSLARKFFPMGDSLGK